MRISPTTKKMGTWVTCPACGCTHTQETAFERWMRNCIELDSRDSGIVRFDLDILLHKYLVKIDGKGSRELQAVMFIEVKTRWAECSNAQKDTLHLLNQLLNNRRPNLHSPPKGHLAQGISRICQTRSIILGKMVNCWLLGGHLLRMDGDAPDSSKKIEWDHRAISANQLISLLRFDLDPHNPSRRIDWRRRYRSWKNETDQLVFSGLEA